jgi:RNA polymerase sigma-70 factor (ECF subfamily)
MNPADHMRDLEALLANERWVVRLARALVRDPDDAADIAQEASIAYWRNPPSDSDKARSWLGRVVRNLVRDRAKRDTRRAAREQDATSAASSTTPESALERLQMHALLAEVVAGLADPYRQALILRYYDELSAAEMSRRLGIPSGTVRWRLKRALEMVRARLDERSSGDRRLWMALISLGREGSREASTEAPVSGGRGRATPAVAIAVVLVAAVVAMKWLRSTGGVPSEEQRPIASQRTFTGSMLPPRAMDRRAAPQFATSSPNEVEQTPGEDATGAIEGVVRDPSGRPIAGARVAAWPRMTMSEVGIGRRSLLPSRTAVTDATGKYRLATLPLDGYGLTANASGYAPARRGYGPGGGIRLHAAGQIVAGMDLRLTEGGAVVRGAVTDVGGGAVPGAQVVAMTWGSDTNEQLVPTGHVPLSTVAVASADGRYELYLRAGQRYVLAAEADGYAQVRLPAETIDRDLTRDIALEPAGKVSGRVVASGPEETVPGAMVRIARTDGRVPFVLTVEADPHGAFSFPAVVPGSYRLWARKGKLAGRVITPLVVAATESAADVTVQVDAGRVITGRVFSADGTAVAGAEVWFTKEEGTTSQEREAVSGPGGRYSVEGVLPGRHAVQIRAKGLVSAQREIVVASADVHDADFVMAGPPAQGR